MCPAHAGGLSITISGGGYFRLMPYWLVRQLAHKQDYMMTYFHPRDFDPGQPLVPGLSLLRRFKSYYGLGTSFAKLARLLRDIEFSDVQSAVAKVAWDQAPRLEFS